MFDDLLTSSAALLAAATPEASEQNTWLLDRFDILLGFTLGLVGTGIIGWIRSRNKQKRFYVAASSELKRLLWVLVGSCVLHNDSEIDENKVKLCFECERKYKLTDLFLPEGDQYTDVGFRQITETVQQKSYADTDIAGYVKSHNSKASERKAGRFLTAMYKVDCRYIDKNLEIVSSLGQSKISRFLCILARIDTLNCHIDSLSWSVNATFDSTLLPENHERIRSNYYAGCQTVSDFAYSTSIEIDGLLNILGGATRAEVGQKA